MISIDISKYMRDRVWFGWWCRDWDWTDDEVPNNGKWVRDPSGQYNRTIRTLAAIREETA